jgi:TPR repeat protein
VIVKVNRLWVGGGMVLLMVLAVILCSFGTLLPARAEAISKASSVADEYRKLSLAEVVRKAKANDAGAQFELGSRFNYGRGVPKNVSEALHWLRSAAQRGNIEAQRLLALKLYYGYDVAADHVEALQWAARLADAGDIPGQMMLANMYANGEGAPRQLVRAYAWYAIAAAAAQQAVEKGEEGLRGMQDVAVDQRDRMAALLLPVEEVEAQRMASDWWLGKAKVKLPGARGVPVRR